MLVQCAPRESDPGLQRAHGALTQQRHRKHRQQRRRQPQRDLGIDAVTRPAVEHEEQRQVAVGDGLKEPVFFEEELVLGMVDERQVPVQGDHQ